MQPSNNLKIVVFVPLDHAEMVREAMCEAGAGTLGSYSNCSFSSRGTGRFVPNEGAHPTVGEVGQYVHTEEERIEILCPKDKVKNVIQKMKEAHPYEEVAYDVYERLDA